MNNAEKRAMLKFLSSVRSATQADILTIELPRSLRFIAMACEAVSDETGSPRVNADPAKVLTEQARWLDQQMMELQSHLFRKGEDKR